MASFKDFLEKVARLDAISDDLRAKHGQLVIKIERLPGVLKKLESERDDVQAQLQAVEEEQAMLMGGSTPTAQAEVFTPRANHDLPHGLPDHRIDRENVVQEEAITLGAEAPQTPSPTPTISSTPIRNLTTTYDAPPGNLRWLFFALKPIHENFPTVVCLDNEWTELHCGICGANAFSHTKKLYQGLTGLRNHGHAAHREHIRDGSSADDTVKTCQRRVLSDEDVRLILDGKEPKVGIAMTMGNATPTKSTPTKKRLSQNGPLGIKRDCDADDEETGFFKTPTKRSKS